MIIGRILASVFRVGTECFSSPRRRPKVNMEKCFWAWLILKYLLSWVSRGSCSPALKTHPCSQLSQDILRYVIKVSGLRLSPEKGMANLSASIIFMMIGRSCSTGQWNHIWQRKCEEKKKYILLIWLTPFPGRHTRDLQHLILKICCLFFMR